MNGNVINCNHIAWIDQHKNISIVQESDNSELRVKKELRIYDKRVFEALIEHPVNGAPRIYECYESNGILTIIEEYIPGKNLEKVLDENGVMSVTEVRDIALKLCDILASLSALGIIHRDIKPSNIIQREDGEIVLVDFNAAKIVKESQSRDTKLLGTEGFAAPEQFGFGASNAQTDIYNLGVLMLVLLTEDTSTAHIPDNDLSPIIKKCTELNPKDRYRNTMQLKKALLRKPLFSSLSKKRKLYISAAIFAALLVSALIAAHFCNSNTRTPVGIYAGNDNEILVIKSDGTATYYCSDLTFQESNCPWTYINGNLTITLDKLHCDVTAKIAKNDFNQILLTSTSSNWNAELFTRTKLTEYDRNLETFDQLITVSDTGNMAFTLLGIDFTVDKKWCDFEDEFDKRDDTVALTSIDVENNVMQAILYYADSSKTHAASDLFAPFLNRFFTDGTMSSVTETTVSNQPALTAEISGTLNIGFSMLSGRTCTGTLTIVEAPDSAGLVYILELETD